MNAAHWPFFVPEKYRVSIRHSINSNPDVVFHLSEGTIKALDRYLAMGMNIDENMGKLEQYLLRLGRKDNTIVVLLTDNGSTFGDDITMQG